MKIYFSNSFKKPKNATMNYTASRVIQNPSIFWSVLFLLWVFYAIINYSETYDTIVMINYFTYLITGTIVMGLFCIIAIKKKCDLSHIFVFFSAIYFAMLWVTPLFDLENSKELWFGKSVYEYASKGTLIALLGYIFFTVGYWTPIKFKIKYKNVAYKPSEQKVLGIWLMFFILSVCHLYLKGMGLLYIFTGGLLGSTANRSTNLNFMGMFDIIMLSLWLIYFIEGKSKSIKLVTFALTQLIFWLYGFRFIMIAAIVSIVIAVMISGKLKINMGKLIAIGIAVFFLIGTVEAARNSVRTGRGAQISLSFERSINQILDNFRIYNTYYGVVGAYPDKYSFYYGHQMFLYTLVLMIPRALWHGKPEPDMVMVLQNGVSELAQKSGQAFPNIGEFYFEFGVLGVCLFMLLFGIVNRYYYIQVKKNPINRNIILYALIYALDFQFIIRGYTPTNFYTFIFAVLPVMFIYKKNRLGLVKVRK